MKDINLSTEIAGIKMNSPVMNASGTFSLNNLEISNLDISKLGALVTKGVTMEPRAGNKSPRLVEVPGGLINSVGLQNLGIDIFLAEELPHWLSLGLPVIVNISGQNNIEYTRLASKLNDTGIAGIEVNISCPNRGGTVFGTSPRLTHSVVQSVKQVSRVPVIVKLTPNVTNIALIAKTAVNAGADVISLVNTFLAMDIDPVTGRALPGRGFGGMSGPAILPQALYKVWQVCQAVQVPVIGMGGIFNAEDAIKFFRAGVSAVAVGTGNFINPLVMSKLVDDIKEFLSKIGCRQLQDIIGTVKFS